MREGPKRRWEVLVVGGGPAGLSAALILGHCRRSVLVLDSGEARNARSRVAIQLGCRLTRKGAVPAGRLQQTNVPGLFVAGDAARDVQMSSVAAAEGVRAAIAINKELTAEERA